MVYISEEEPAALVTHELAFDAAREALVAAASRQSGVFPAVLGRTREATNTFSIKSGSSDHLTRVKIGSFWSGNPARGLPRHNSTIVLLDQHTGRLGAVIEAGKVNAYRTAAADAVAADVLARKQAKVLAIFGAGNQAGFEVMALARIRPIETVLVVARPSPRRDALVDQIGERGPGGARCLARRSRARGRHRGDGDALTRTAVRCRLGRSRNPYRQHGVGCSGQARIAERIISQGTSVL
jgi:ornithine cyclodeaminase